MNENFVIDGAEPERMARWRWLDEEADKDGSPSFGCKERRRSVGYAYCTWSLCIHDEGSKVKVGIPPISGCMNPSPRLNKQ